MDSTPLFASAAEMSSQSSAVEFLLPVRALNARQCVLPDGTSFKLHVNTKMLCNDTGGDAWKGSWALATLLNLRRAQLTGKRVLELGSGTGLLGISCALSGACSVVVTDLPYVLPLIQKNISSAVVHDAVSVFEWDWGNPRPAFDSDIPFDIVVAADVVYDPEKLDICCSAMRAAAEACVEGGWIFVALSYRSQLESEFLSAIRQWAFVEDLDSTAGSEAERVLFAQLDKACIATWKIRPKKWKESAASSE
jgi:predicted nicotinamide N-methyase